MDGARYEIERVLGRGGMATVYLAWDVELGRPVALKLLAEHLAGDEDPGPHSAGGAGSRPACPSNIVQVYDLGEDERGLFIVMEYVDGAPLAEELARGRSAPPD